MWAMIDIAILDSSSPQLLTHDHFRLSVPDEIDASLVELLREAYAIGQQASVNQRLGTNRWARAAVTAKRKE